MELDFEGMDEKDIAMLKEAGYRNIAIVKDLPEKEICIETPKDNEEKPNPLFNFAKIAIKTNKLRTPVIKINYWGTCDGIKHSALAKALVKYFYPDAIFGFIVDKNKNGKFAMEVNQKVVYDNKSDKYGDNFSEELHGVANKMKRIVEPVKGIFKRTVQADMSGIGLTENFD